MPPADLPDKTDILWSICRFSRDISVPHASIFLDSLAGLPKSDLLDLLCDPMGWKASLDKFINNNPIPRQYETSYSSVSSGNSAVTSQGRGSQMVLDPPLDSCQHEPSMGMGSDENAPEVRRPALELTLPSAETSWN